MTVTKRPYFLFCLTVSFSGRVEYDMFMINKDTNKHFKLVLCVEHSFYMHRIVGMVAENANC